ncbi:DUF3090 domain-containing protein [Planomonospora venezuelensis]|uniref:Putative repeat protein (TIGR03847 family) n=1 Tax=Planomonospora venezuelensis TaxID=1999 RepID=A0A841D2V0_PLAVE|nr:DUF3090 domain-containing protein [Planomonospora venezuelensis]MBB5963303.1 putative repeat protein (TIGR03847 family) [Planomonospora venezuelensis]GIN02708.1 hypothetical protein Pve01_43660 [Planomonospora venezuelensis]
MPVFDYDPPERFVAGAVGQPGARTFFLQARGQGRLTTVGLEKFQVAALADRLDDLLDEVVRLGGEIPAAPAGPADTAPLDVPISEDFRVGTMTLGWDSEASQVVIEAQEAVPDEEEFEPPLAEPAMLRVRIGPAEARAFSRRALALVAAGRPPCPLCGQPLDAEGHICVRLNGYRGKSASPGGGGG